MGIDPLSDAKILDAWQRNAAPWTAAVRGQQIESRRLVTDRAIIEATLSRSPRSVLDLGCGEGWFARALTVRGIEVIGIDAIPALIEQARQSGGDFRVMSYEDIASGKLNASVDAVVCNFALLGNESVAGLFGAVRSLLNPHGSLLVQTLHPLVACGDKPYLDGWREGSWAGFNADFRDPAPWYFRTLESWTRLFAEHGFQLLELREPLHPQTRQPASVIFIAQAMD
ncbi:methyltransferase [Rhodanobacter panaciterrae]|uniref:Methyltransferase n=1 Tax=Rhodanobacter panaciterrae TaxID=490572 RepID=A0ABQ3A1Z9_9GAMM|nr:class I SAM-dependent methyltransferase [Rhodanobacter panaciterrae]GGY29765.1 methyltransferase [Rhodanobacter panaciterrae]